MRIARFVIVPNALCAAASLAGAQDSIVPALAATPAVAAAPARPPVPEPPRPAPVVDRVDAEREALARIANELEAIEAMAREAAQSAPSMARVQFRYDWLIADLRLMGARHPRASGRAAPAAPGRPAQGRLPALTIMMNAAQIAAFKAAAGGPGVATIRARSPSYSR